MKKIFIFLTLIMSLVMQLAFATIPAKINYQGRLTDKTGNPVTDGNYSVTFSIYDVDTGGTHLWRDVYTVTTKNGYFNVSIGSITDLSSLTFDTQYYLGIKVETEPSEMTPRHLLDSAAYAMRAKHAIDAASATIAATALSVADNTITSAKIIDGAVGSADIADGSITSADIGSGQVGLTDIDSNAVMPIGVILPWHKSVYSFLPNNWVECNGGNVNNPTSPIHGVAIPNLNGEGRFLRGSATSGTFQADELKSHAHTTVASSLTDPKNEWHVHADWANASEGPTENTTATGGTETRPTNMSVVWIMKIK